MVGKETTNEERLILLGLRAMSYADLDVTDSRIEMIFLDNLIDGPRSLPHFKTKDFCLKLGQCLLNNQRLDLTPKHLLKITDEELAVGDRGNPLHTILELKKVSENDLSFYTSTHGILSDYHLNLYLLKKLKSECEICGSRHQFGDIAHFNRYVLTQDRQFQCYCPDCLSKLFPDFDQGFRMTEANKMALTGLEIFDSDEKLKEYLINATPMEYRSLANPYTHYYSHTYKIWELCSILGTAYHSDKKIELESDRIKGVPDCDFTRLHLR